MKDNIKQQSFNQGEAIEMHNLRRLIQDTSMRMTNIFQKQPALKVCTKMEIISCSAAEAVRSLCRDTAEHSHKFPADLVDTTEMVALQIALS